MREGADAFEGAAVAVSEVRERGCRYGREEWKMITARAARREAEKERRARSAKKNPRRS